jgi:hypothetical protein
MVIGTAYDILSKVTPPRAVFVDHPVGRTFGPPHDQPRNETVLVRALAEVPRFTRSGEIREMAAAHGRKSCARNCYTTVDTHKIFIVNGPREKSRTKEI